MNLSQLCTFFVCLIFCIGHGQLDDLCGLWYKYKDEKCFDMIDATLRTFDEAEKACAKLDDSSSLPIIRSKEEQDFLTMFAFKLLYETYFLNHTIDNIWIGARFSENKFHWIDNTDLNYTNWEEKGTNNKTNNCVQMQENPIGKWIDVPCEQKKLVVCQKQQSWSNARLRDNLLKFKDSLDFANKKIYHLERNLIPIGFIYAQLPYENSPAEIWPLVKWSDVSTTYAGVFFRVNGGDSAAFGQVQQADAPRLEEIFVGDVTHIAQEHRHGINSNITIPKSASSKGIVTGSDKGSPYLYAQFKHSTGEVRPLNIAIRIWKRTA